MSVVHEVEAKTREAKEASRRLSRASSSTKDSALLAMAETLMRNAEAIENANKFDLASGEKKGLSPVLLDRLRLNQSALRAWPLACGPGESRTRSARFPRSTEGQTDSSSGRCVFRSESSAWYSSRGQRHSRHCGAVHKVRNAIVMRGGSEAIHSNKLLVELLSTAADPPAYRAPRSADRIDQPRGVRALATSDGFVDLMVVRGGLVRVVSEYATVPLIAHGKGLCHIYVDRMPTSHALLTSPSTKVQRPSVCNAIETLLVHEEVAPVFLEPLVRRLCDAGVELVGCARTLELLKGKCAVLPATDDDWDTEYLSLKLSIRVVRDCEEAVEHIFRYGCGHSEAIVTENYSTAMRFLHEVDAAAVLVNASTRLVDGFELGLGAELGISTQKLHARGPMGLMELTCEKFVVLGQGQIREG